MIRDECERFKPTKNYLESLTNLPPLDTDMFLVSFALFGLLLCVLNNHSFFADGYYEK